MPADHDDLIARLRERAHDPDRRTDSRDSAFSAAVGAMDLGAMAELLQRTQGDLAAVMAAGPDGPPDDLSSPAPSSWDG